jgi:hypothetical protein
MGTIRHKCFLSYHHDDQDSVRKFIEKFDEDGDVFITRGISMPEDVIDSEDPDYVMRRIRTLYLKESTVTIVLMGECTWARKFVDWEVQASLRQPADGKPNGLLAVLLDKNATKGTLPNRVRLNTETGYAQYRAYPGSAAALSTWIDTAFKARTDYVSLIVNPRDRRKNNGSCP